ncbi:MAG: rhodanese-related sulfurtransferase [Parcubacteria group bacterium]|nr:rhodanese-related sulfurtransferase [Parcubacteria group bacterium]
MLRKANKRSPEELRKRLEAETFTRTSISFYRYVRIKDPEALRDQLYDLWDDLGVLGRIYVAHEGINAQLNVPDHNVKVFRMVVDQLLEFNGVPFKIGIHEDAPSFIKLTIKVREYILADGLLPGEYDVTNVGKHLSAREFNDAIDQGAVVVDMRNNYESDIGRFDGALLPDVTTFAEELPVVSEMLRGQEDKKILLYCTGGIRCEKASAYLREGGFKDVNQLHGGIIDYKHQIDREGLESKFKGRNFVFDGRSAEPITDDVLGVCYQCSAPSSTHANCKNTTCNILFIQCDACKDTFNRSCSGECRDISFLPIEEQEKLRKGVKVFGRIVAR